MLRPAAVLAAAILAFSPSLLAAANDSWRVEPAPSDHPDLTAATARNADGHTVYVWRLNDAAGSHVFCELHLAKGMAFAGEMPVFRIDDDDAVDTAEIRAAGDARSALWAHVGDTVAFWLLASRPDERGAGNAGLRPWLAGRELAITFRSADGVEQTTRFSLAGSAEAIRAATGFGGQ